MGNPTWYSTFLDEHLNGKIADVAVSCHRATWERRVFEKLERLRLFQDKDDHPIGAAKRGGVQKKKNACAGGGWPRGVVKASAASAFL